MKTRPTSKAASSRTRILAAIVFLAAGVGLTLFAVAGAPDRNAKSTGNSPAPMAAHIAALQELPATPADQITAKTSNRTGVYNFVKAPAGALLAGTDAALSVEQRAFDFLSRHGALVGLTAAERTALSQPEAANSTGSTLRVLRTHADQIGESHVKMDQFYQGLPVFGAQLVVHLNDKGVTGVSGDFVPAIALKTVPAFNSQAAGERTVLLLQKKGEGKDLRVTSAVLQIYPAGLLEGSAVTSRLAYAVEVTSSTIHEQVWLDAQTGTILNRIPLRHTALNRIVYTPNYDPMFAVRREGDPYTPGATPGTTGADPINNLYLFAGNTYHLMRSGFGRDSYDAAGHIMHSVLLANQQCPNAYWNGIATNYCPDFDADDVVSHEWGHAYTQFTHNLIYSYQSGALNESYSDIMGETADLLNGVDAEGGGNNIQPMPTGQRWQVGEDVNGFNQPALGILRDMWTPTRFRQPDRSTNSNYSCGAGDGGGVHKNSGVPNHAYAMLVDGKTFNGQTVAAIGFVRALAIYYRAMTVYQTPSTDFATHATALRTSCTDLIGQPLNALSTSSSANIVSPDVIDAGTCVQVNKAMLAVEMDNASPCPAILLLNPDTPPLCSGPGDIYAEDWETGDDGWTRTSTGVTPDWEDSTRNLRDFTVSSSLPAGRVGSAAYARNIAIGEPGGGTCAPGGDYSGQFTITSPIITIPPDASDLKLRFDHYVATEGEFDGGQVEISVNGGAFVLVPQGNYEFNAPNAAFSSAIDGNTNPNAGEFAWNGTNINTPSGQPPGSWGTTIVNLASMVSPGNTVRIRFTESQDGCNGVDGWYVDNIHLYKCAAVTGNCPPPPYTDDLEPAQQTGWTFQTAQNVLPSPTWALVSNPNAHSPTHSFNSDGSVPDIKDDRLIAPPQNLTASSRLIFWHSHNLEDGYDGGVLEVSTNGGSTWVDVGAGSFISGGYTTTINSAFSSPISGRQAWSFVNTDYPSMSRVEVNLGAFAGDNVLVRWRLALDNGVLVPGALGWFVDDVQFTNLKCDIAAPVPTAVLSRKVHGAAGTFDIPLPLAGIAGIECRTGGVSQIVMSFAQPVTFTGATVSGGTGTVSSTSGSGTNSAVINLTGVTDAQVLTVTLNGASAGGPTAEIPVTIRVLLGDTTENAIVNASDVSQAKSFSGAITTPGNFRSDVTANGVINSSDIGAIKSQSGSALSRTAHDGSTDAANR